MYPSGIVLDPSQAQVRLIKLNGGELYPGDSDDSGVPSYSMRLESLEDELTYSALSYTWEPIEPKHAIMVNGHEAFVGHNLWQFLQYAAQAMPDTDFWIDQLCIDQNSKDELNHQVGLMSKIFGLSDRTVVWLGPGDTDTDCAIGNLGAQSEIIIGDMTVIREPVAIEQNDVLDRGLYKLFSCPYWHRLWIVQEFCLSTNINVVCGEQEIAWTDSILEYLSKRYGNLELSFAKSVQWLETTKHNVKNYSETLRNLVVRYCDFGCTRKHDKVFGLMGLLPERHRIPINYNIPLERLVVQLFEHIRTDDDIFASRHIVRNMLGSTEYASLLVGIGLGELSFELMVNGRTGPNKEIRKMCEHVEASSSEGQRLLRSGRGMVDLVGQSDVMRTKYETTWFLERRDEEEFFVRGFSNLQNPYGMWQALSMSMSLPAKRFSFRDGDHSKIAYHNMEAIRKRIQNFIPHAPLALESMNIIVETGEEEKPVATQAREEVAEIEPGEANLEPEVIVHQETIHGKPAWIDFEIRPFGRKYRRKYTRLKQRFGHTVHLSKQYRAMLMRVLDLAEAIKADQENEPITSHLIQVPWISTPHSTSKPPSPEGLSHVQELVSDSYVPRTAPIAICGTRKVAQTYPKNAYIANTFLREYGQ